MRFSTALETNGGVVIPSRQLPPAIPTLILHIIVLRRKPEQWPSSVHYR